MKNQVKQKIRQLKDERRRWRKCMAYYSHTSKLFKGTEFGQMMADRFKAAKDEIMLCSHRLKNLR